ncbi:MAG: lysylphosphatidylglycerol synthase domain-containing protein, partial [Micromonosporaceae bacterium]
MQTLGVTVEDHTERRIRKPVDLLRFVVGCLGIAALAVAGLVAHATAAGAATDIASASRKLPGALLGVLGLTSALALLVLPVALAVRQLIRQQPRRLAEAAATTALTLAVVVAVNTLLRQPVAADLHAAITVARGGHEYTTPLDGYLAGLAAYVTVLGRPRWRAAVGLALGAYALAALAASRTTILSLLITLLLGRTIGVGVRYAAGLPSERPHAEEIADALISAGLPVATMRRLGVAGSAPRLYAAATPAGEPIDVTVFDRDQEAAGALYRFYRRIRLQGQITRGMPLSLERTLERCALLSYAAAEAAVRTPRLRAIVRAGPEAIVLAYEHDDGTTLAEQENQGTAATDAQLRKIWDAVLRLHSRRVTHRALTADRILITREGDIVLLDPGNGDVAASDLQLRLDMAQLLAELGLVVGPDRAANSALDAVGAARLVTVVPLLQPVALYRSTRAGLRRNGHVLPALRNRLLAAAPEGEIPPVRLERVRLRTLVSLVAGVVAAYVLAGQLAKVNLASLVRHADWRWTAVALLASALGYGAATLSLSGFVLERLNFVRTLLAQVAASFVTLVTPAAVGGAALNIRYLQRSGVPAAGATASVGVAQVMAFVLHMLLLVIFAVITGAAQIHSLRPPTWAYLVLAGLVILALAVTALPSGRRLLRA